MKRILNSLALCIAVALSALNLQAQTATFKAKVFGNCNHCKQNIEKALDIEGVSSANWDKKAKMLTVEYDSAKLTEKDIKNKVAAAGYDFEDQKGDDAAYGKLAKCCRYRSSAE